MACRSRHPTVRHNLLRRRGEVAPLSLQHTLSLSLSLSLSPKYCLLRTLFSEFLQQRSSNFCLMLRTRTS
ncbi:unnamed protein product [Musa acuminata subsp. malaccensis]|uniref:(wild Malaysian banana) hypothetical protein n=1 Tax=Musa acuminata subsp. malaccensis TaxID=214687 RepID=A0A8D7A8F8_MUSAM|nr:unnamed protein product [Musa acuminata subsp. malaccensis]